MAKPRSELSALLHTICDDVYFQPPANLMLSYPCIIYEVVDVDVTYADNGPYTLYNKYTITYITRDPDDVNRHEIIFKLPLCSMDRSFPNDNLYHFVYTMYF